MEPSLFPKIIPLFLTPPHPGLLAPPGHGKGMLNHGEVFGNSGSLPSHASEVMLWQGFLAAAGKSWFSGKAGAIFSGSYRRALA